MEGAIRICAWCRRLLIGQKAVGGPYTPEQVIDLRRAFIVSDAICPSCEREQRLQLESLIAEREASARLDGLSG
jgi:hypothetical protein